MALNPTQREFLNRRMGQVPFLTGLGDQIYALQVGLVSGETDPTAGNQVPTSFGFDQGAIPSDAIASSGTATGTTSATAGTAVTASASYSGSTVPIVRYIVGNVYLTAAPTVSGGQVTFSVASSVASEAFTIAFC